jgi:hypothetical protein
LAAEATKAICATDNFRRNARAGSEARTIVLTTPQRSPRSTRDTIRQREDQKRGLIAALLRSIVPHGHDLASRLHRCQQARMARREWHDPRHAVSDDYPYMCRSLACWACRRTIIRRWSDNAGRRFSNAAQGECSKISISLACTSGVEATRDAVVKARKDLGNMRAAASQQPGGWRWRSVQVFGLVDVAASIVGAGTQPPSTPHTPISRFSTVTPAGTGFWFPRVRLAVHHPHLDRPELARAIMDQWLGWGRVIVERFANHQSAADNAAAIIDGALEQVCQAGSDDGTFCSTACRQAAFHAWLFGLRRGLQPLGISLRPQVNEPSIARALGGIVEPARGKDAWTPEWDEPMPFVF